MVKILKNVRKPFLLEIIFWRKQIIRIPLHRVFHGIRLLRLIKDWLS